MNILSSLRFIGLVSLAAACGGNTLDGGSRQNQSAIAGEEAPPSSGHHTAAQVEAAKAACNGPHGPVDSTPTREDAAQRLVGGWYLCSESSPVYFSKSLEFTDAGRFYVLVDDGAGGLKGSQGIGNEGAWNFDDLYGSVGTSQGPAEFEREPRRMRISISSTPYANWYVPLGN